MPRPIGILGSSRAQRDQRLLNLLKIKTQERAENSENDPPMLCCSSNFAVSALQDELKTTRRRVEIFREKCRNITRQAAREKKG